MKQHSNASLQAESGLDDSSPFKLKESSTVFGIAPIADKTIKAANVSRRHFQIRSDDGVYYIIDLDSTNGTYLNGELLLPNVERRVKDGDLIGLVHNSVVLRFVDPLGTEKIDASTLLIGGSPTKENLVIDPVLRKVWVRGQILDPDLTIKQFDILEFLYRNRGSVMTRDQIAEAGWPGSANSPDSPVSNESIDAFISKLRGRIEVNPSKHKIIITLRKRGFRIN